MKEIEHSHRSLSIWLSEKRVQHLRILLLCVLKSSQEQAHP